MDKWSGTCLSTALADDQQRLMKRVLDATQEETFSWIGLCQVPKINVQTWARGLDHLLPVSCKGVCCSSEFNSLPDDYLEKVYHY